MNPGPARRLHTGMLLAGLLLSGLLASCAAHERLAVTEVLNRDSCHAVSPGVHRTGFPQLAAIRGAVLLGMTDADQEEQPATTGQPELLLLAISRGTQPTPGYRFKLTDAYVNRVQGVRVGMIELAWITPPEDALLAQVITHPCIVVGLSGGGLDRVRAVIRNDTSGDELVGEFAL